MSTGDSVPFNARFFPLFPYPCSFSRGVSLLRCFSSSYFGRRSTLSSSVVIRVLSFVRFLFSRAVFLILSQADRPVSSFRFILFAHCLLDLFVADGIHRKTGLPSLTLPFCFSLLLSLCLSSLRLLYLRFSPFPSFFRCFFRCCRFLEFQRYELARDASEGAGINWDYFLKSYWRTRTLELLV